MILCKEELAADDQQRGLPRPAGRPAEHIVAAKAVALRIAQSEQFKERQRQTIANAQAFADELIAGGIDVLTGGTDVHLVLVDLANTGLDGKTPRIASRRSASPSTATRSPSTSARR